MLADTTWNLRCLCIIPKGKTRVIFNTKHEKNVSGNSPLADPKFDLIHLKHHVKSVRKWKFFFNNCYKCVSGHFLAICIFIFHKTEVQMVILRCLTGLNLNWFKSYGLRCKLRPKTSSANFWKIATDKWSF